MAEETDLLTFKGFSELEQLDPDQVEEFSTYLREEYGEEPDEVDPKIRGEWRDMLADSKDYEDEDEDEDEDE